ncbi:MAG: hypothetical protein KZQ58_04035 [gamma proteobacterium symbiont of Bathyaustriella thionipta]|nr:hypothetical protein [gamma proteobacterium symbiont of Bathyaustriella thionipta]
MDKIVADYAEDLTKAVTKSDMRELSEMADDAMQENTFPAYYAKLVKGHRVSKGDIRAEEVIKCMLEDMQDDEALEDAAMDTFYETMEELSRAFSAEIGGSLYQCTNA